MPTNNTIKLYVPKPEEIKSYVNFLESNYSKEYLVDKVVRYSKQLKQKYIEYFDADDNYCKPDKIISTFIGNTSTKPIYQAKKADLAHIYTVLIRFKKNFQNVIETLPPSTRHFAEFLVKQGIASVNDLVREGGNNSYSIKLSRYFWSGEDEYTFSQSFEYFNWWIDYPLRAPYTYNQRKDNTHYIIFDSSWHWYIKCGFDDGGGRYNLIPVEDLLEGVVFNNVDMLGSNMSIFEVMANSGTLRKGSTVIITKPQMKKVLESIPGYTIFDNRFNANLSDILVRMLALSVVKNQNKWIDKRKLIPTFPERFKTIYESMENINDNLQLFTELLPDVGGITKATASATDAGLYVKLLKILLFDQVRGKWLDVKCIEEWMYRNVVYNNLPFILRSRGFRTDSWVHIHDKTTIDPCKAMKYLAIPFVHGLLMLFASLGFIELFIKPTEKGENLFSGIRYVRVTDLGKFVSGKKESFILDTSDKYTHQYDLIDEPLMVIGRYADNPYNDWLSKVAIKRGLSWMFTPKSFIRNCKSVDELDFLVNEFRNYICQKPSAAWEQFFDNLHMRIGRNVCESEYIPYTVVKLNRNNKELLEYLASLPNLSDYAVKAENYRLLVPRANYSNFEKLLKDGGFII